MRLTPLVARGVALSTPFAPLLSALLLAVRRLLLWLSALLVTSLQFIRRGFWRAIAVALSLTPQCVRRPMQ